MTDELEQLYKTTYTAVVRFLYRKDVDAERAEDLAQEVFVRALSAQTGKAAGLGVRGGGQSGARRGEGGGAPRGGTSRCSRAIRSHSQRRRPRRTMSWNTTSRWPRCMMRSVR